MSNIDELKYNIDFLGLFHTYYGGYLTKATAGWCPFHNDKGSKQQGFSIDTRTNRGRCFSSHCSWVQGGDVIDLYMAKYPVDRNTAIIKLLEIEGKYPRSNISSTYKDINKRFLSYLDNGVKLSDEWKTYLDERMVLEVVQHLLDIKHIGLNQYNGQISLCIPVYKPAYNDIISIQYINLNGTKTFAKDCPANGYFDICERNDKITIITESFFDACSIYQVDKTKSVSTIFSTSNISILDSFASSITLAFDNDMAGIEATKKVIDKNSNAQSIDWNLYKGKGKDINDVLKEWEHDTIKLMVDNVAVNTEYTRLSDKFSHIQSAYDIVMTDYPDPYFIIKDFLPEGLTLLCGKPKRGKSWLCLNLGLCLAYGGKALGRFDLDGPIDVLYIALEDNYRRLKKRLKQIHPGDVPKNFYIQKDWPKGDECITDITDWLKYKPQTKLVIIDTLEKVMPELARGGNNQLYKQDYNKALPLKKICDDHSIGIIAIHHLNKREDDGDPLDVISGSTGLTAAVDTPMVLNRDAKKADGKLFITGRDMEEREYFLDFDKKTGTWIAKGDGLEFNLSDNEIKVYMYIKDNDCLCTRSEMLQSIPDIKSNSLDTSLKRLVDRKYIINVASGTYQLNKE